MRKLDVALDSIQGAIKEVPEKKATSFVHAPKVYYRHYSTFETPTLRLMSGDTVHTSTVYSSGTGNNSKRELCSNLFSKTTGAQIPVDGRNERVI